MCGVKDEFVGWVVAMGLLWFVGGGLAERDVCSL